MDVHMPSMSKGQGRETVATLDAKSRGTRGQAPIPLMGSVSSGFLAGFDGCGME
jgi:hypothetical protein